MSDLQAIGAGEQSEDKGMSITIDNIRTCPSPDGKSSIYVGRPSALGNPYQIGRDGDRQECIAKYADWLDAQLADPASAAARKFAALRQALATHGTLTLVCWCAPERCHAEVIRDRLLGHIPPEHVCQSCGCTEDDACVVQQEDFTGMCWWEEDDLCSACAGEVVRIRGPLRDHRERVEG